MGGAIVPPIIINSGMTNIELEALSLANVALRKYNSEGID